MNDSIFLVGLMGCGKTYIGQKLAAAMSYNFLDLDHYLEEDYGSTIVSIFENKGESFFRQLEHDYLLSLRDKRRHIFSTGGGLPCFHQNIEIMNSTGITVYLKVTPEIIVKRISNQRDHRPLLKNFANDIELLNFIEKKMIEREAFYKKAKIIINADADPTAIIKEITSKIKIKINEY